MTPLLWKVYGEEEQTGHFVVVAKTKRWVILLGVFHKACQSRSVNSSKWRRHYALKISRSEFSRRFKRTKWQNFHPKVVSRITERLEELRNEQDLERTDVDGNSHSGS